MKNLFSLLRARWLFWLASLCVILVSRAAVADEKPTKKIAEKPADEPKRIKQLPDGRVILPARDATIHGAKLHYEKQKGTLGYWFNAEDWVSWEFEITKPGKLVVDLAESCDRESAGSHYTVEVGDQILKDKVQGTGSFRQFRLRRPGTFEFAKPGIYTLSVRVQDKPRLAVMDLRGVTLQPPDFDKRPLVKPDGKKPAAAPTKPVAQSPATVPPALAPPSTTPPTTTPPTTEPK
ncbi:MAG TPA: hypothetical protein VHX65_12520 [Pirellulales bacterium]|jgi:hypothetical protein|nr:hypothetical protein [Pirellulales bacterium]